MVISEVKEADIFKLTFKTFSFGSNMLKMQIVFRVIDTKFNHTWWQTWTSKNEKPEKTDILNSGNFRNFSIDSILSVVEELQDSVVNKIDSYTLNGCDNYIEISTQPSKVTFRLKNKNDIKAQKIVDILNCDIPKNFRKLQLFASTSD